MVQVRLLRPLDGRGINEIADYPEADAKRLAERGIVELAEAKSEPAPMNKMAPLPPNKSRSTKRKGS